MYSQFGDAFAIKSGTRELMDDLGAIARGGRDLINLGGGNPSLIPAMQAMFERAWASVPAADWVSLASVYDAPQGHPAFLERMSEVLRTQFGWPVKAGNLLVTSGSQASFFALFNLFGGTDTKGCLRQILLPQAPEYIGYAQSGIAPAMLTSFPGLIEHVADHRFKYRPDFDRIAVTERHAAVCVSRPCNPTGNVITDEELARLRHLAQDAGVPLIVDCAYGQPFPGIVFAPASLAWDEDLIVCLSLSKLGLPGLRTGLVVAKSETIDLLTSINAMLTLAPNPVGARLMLALMAEQDVLALAREVVGPHYAAASRRALAACDELLGHTDYLAHVSEGAIFLWLWFPRLPVPVQQLYERLKARGVLVIPGHHFGPGLSEPWPHLGQCLRLSYAQPEERLRAGLRVLAEELRALGYPG